MSDPDYQGCYLALSNIVHLHRSFSVALGASVFLLLHGNEKERAGAENMLCAGLGFENPPNLEGPEYKRARAQYLWTCECYKITPHEGIEE